MKVFGLDQREYNLSLKIGKQRKVSTGHEEARHLLKDIFPSHIIYEEVTLPGSKSRARTHPLYADFLLPNLKIVVEVHGEQHYKYNSFFHKDKFDFLAGRKRDQDKKRWCEINDFSYIELNDNDRTNWRDRIIDGI